MKNIAVPLLLLGIGAFQAIRIDSVLANSPDHYEAVAARADAVEKWRAAPYVIEPPDVLSIELTWTNIDSKSIKETPTLNGNWQAPKISMSYVQRSFQRVETGTRIRTPKM